MRWRDEYRSRLVSAPEAVRRLESGQRVVIGHACAEPQALVRELVAQGERLADVEIVHMVPMGEAAYCSPGMRGHFRHNSLFAGPPTRRAIEDGDADYTPVFFSEVPDLLRRGLPVDVALVHLSPPDRHGWCSFGLSVDYTKPAAQAARTVIAQVNPQMPRTLGDSFIHVSELDAIIEVDEPVIELPRPQIGEVEAGIGGNCAALVRDGDTLQLGIGAIPDAVALSLRDKKDLGIHSEMLSDGVVDLIEAGVVTGRRKNFHPGRSVVSFLMGTRRLYDFVDDNPSVEMAPVDFVNNPAVIARNDNLVSINSCVQIDLLGQVVSTSVGPRQISGVGGQVDFVRGASMSAGGRTVMALASTAREGKISKIVPLIDSGAAVTTSRYDVDYVVTEHGVAQLRGKTSRQRSRELISVAHPDFRDQLAAEHERRHHEAWATDAVPL
ncbi:MAG: hypothetical protein LBK95_13795 [Bifidobacteriaceae bacterium]|jgi:4-hydroxybutyrate CoA-transferase|nr:hypothetical protein [Bifidobacteriaceae bacterium]